MNPPSVSTFTGFPYSPRMIGGRVSDIAPSSARAIGVPYAVAMSYPPTMVMKPRMRRDGDHPDAVVTEGLAEDAPQPGEPAMGGRMGQRDGEAQVADVNGHGR